MTVATQQPTWAWPTANAPVQRRQGRARRPVVWLLSHASFLLLAGGCYVTYQHLKLAGRPTAGLACLVLAAVLAFMPLRHLVRALLGIEGKALHVVHGVGSLALVALPLAGLVSGTPLVTHAWLAPFAIMGAAQAVMHQDHPRNAAQAAALRRFAASLPEVARFADSKDAISPENARRAIAVLSDVIGKAQALGQTELASDPGFQGVLRAVSMRWEAGLGLDAVAVALRRLGANPAAAGAVPGLERRLAAARRAVAGAGTP